MSLGPTKKGNRNLNSIPERDQNSTGQAEQGRGPEINILVVEDNSLVQASILYQLELLGYRADGVIDGVEALETLRQQPYEVIFMDLNMPRLDGFEATALIRRQGPNGRQPYIIALTANDHLREACLAAGMNDFLTKPATVHQMALALNRAVNDRPPSD